MREMDDFLHLQIFYTENTDAFMKIMYNKKEIPRFDFDKIKEKQHGTIEK